MKRGNSVECTYCGWQGSEFLSYRGRAQSRCPRCGSNERIRFLWLNLGIFDKVEPDSSRVLHFAPEPWVRKMLESLVPKGYVCTDLERSDVDVRMSITDIIF